MTCAATAERRSAFRKARPLRLAPGSDADDATRNHSEAVLAELASWEKVSRGVNLVVPRENTA